VTNPTLSPAANAAGWNNRNVTVNWNWTDDLSGIVNGPCELSSTSNGEGVQTLTAFCADEAGNVTQASYTVKVDRAPPLIQANVSPAANGFGWYNSAVTIHFTCADNLSGTITCPADQTLSSEGAAVSSSAQTVLDQAENSSAASNIVTLKLDKTAPSVLLTGVTDGATYPFGSVPTAACSTTDALSGVATPATLSVTGGNGDGRGNFTATCSGATDLAGNSAAPVSVNYTVNGPSPTATPTATPMDTPTATSTATAPDAPTALPTNMPTATATSTASPSATPTTTVTPTVPATSLYATVQQVRTSLAALLSSGNTKTDQALRNAIAKLDDALTPAFWQLPAGNQLSSQGETAFHRLRDAIKAILTLNAPPAAVTTALTSLTNVGRTLAEQAIAAATAAGGNAKQIAKANKELGKAQEDLAKRRPDLAFGHYEEAWEAAQDAQGISLAEREPDEVATDDVHDDVDQPTAPDQSAQTNRIFLPMINR